MWYKSMPFFRELTEEEGNAVMAIAQIRAFDEGEVIFEDGQDGPGLFVIQSGEVTVQKPLPIGGAEVLAELQPGEFFGEISLVTDLPAAAEAVASEETVTIFLPREDLLELIQTSPEIEIKFLREFVRTLCNRLAEANDLLVTNRMWHT